MSTDFLRQLASIPRLTDGSHLAPWHSNAIYGIKHSIGSLREEQHRPEHIHELQVI